MRVAFDTTPLARPVPPGVARLAREVLSALRRRGRIEVIEIAPPAAARLVAWRQRSLPRAARSAGAEVLHSFLSAIPLAAAMPVVQTVHELPWRSGERENSGWGHRAWARLGSRRAAAVVTASRSVAAALGPRARIVPWGVGVPFLAAATAGEAEVRAARERAGLGDAPFVLAPGATRRKKRLAWLLAAAAVAEEPWLVAVTGPPGDALQESRPSAGAARLRELGRVGDGELALLYRASCATASLARSEGFSLPVLESLAAGTPVVVPRGSVQAETAGAFAAEIEPGDARALAAALDALARVAPDEATRHARAEFARAFTWERAAAALEELYRDLREGRR